MRNRELLESIPYMHCISDKCANIEKFNKAMKSEIVLIRNNKAAKVFYGFNFPNDVEICFSPSMDDFLIVPDLSSECTLRKSIYSYKEKLKSAFDTFFFMMCCITFDVVIDYSNQQLDEFIDNLLYGVFAKFKKIYF